MESDEDLDDIARLMEKANMSIATPSPKVKVTTPQRIAIKRVAPVIGSYEYDVETDVHSFGGVSSKE